MWHELAEEVQMELSLLRRLVGDIDGLRGEVRDGTPGSTQLYASAALLHSFYTGVENIFKRVAVHLDGSSPGSPAWHLELLESMATRTPSRGTVITESLKDRLAEYLRFRHRFRYSYSFDLDWKRIAPLLGDCSQVLRQLEEELDAFLKGA